jgi:hypothetical protein
MFVNMPLKGNKTLCTSYNGICIVTCIRGVTVRRDLVLMIGFIALIHSTRNYE